MTDKIALRMVEDGSPIRFRSKNVSVGRGRTCIVSEEDGNRLLDNYDFFEELCGTVKEDGEICTQSKGNCQYHDDDEDKPDS